MASSSASEPERSAFDVHAAWLRKLLGKRADNDRFVLVSAQVGSSQILAVWRSYGWVIAVNERRPCCPNRATSQVSFGNLGARVGHAAVAGAVRCWA
jgi:hypothetical protein